ncbi:unnamed protein product [Lactuca virosa]|uniref:Uncharacterized protein n=1 Tax=Lactuca virosa TaxID=75947 RepID=A0AAU9M183_9ASTR|nr:unnamed protein product [Lactuca virosa]
MIFNSVEVEVQKRHFIGYDFWIIVAICESVLSCLKIGLDAALGSIFVNQRRLMKTLLLPSKFVILCE